MNKPCRFCNSDNTQLKVQAGVVRWVECLYCGAHGPAVEPNAFPFDTTGENKRAWDAWNNGVTTFQTRWQQAAHKVGESWKRIRRAA